MRNEEYKTPQNPNSESDSASKASKPADSASENSPTIEAVKTTAKDVLDKAKDSAGQVYGIAAETATAKITEQKSNLSGGLSGVAGGIRQIGEDLRTGDEKNPFADLTAKYGDVAAEKVEQLSGYFERKDLKEIYRDVEGFARRQPAAFIAISFAVGLLAARFLKSSGKDSAKAGRKYGDDNSRQQFQNANNPDNSVNQAINAS